MALEYVVAGRRALPGGFFRLRTWTFAFALEDERSEDDEDYDYDAPMFDDGSLELCEIRRRGNGDFYAFVEKHAGFTPQSVVTIRKAGWDFSRAAAEVLAAALDGVYFVDGTVEELGLEGAAIAATEPASSVAELEARIAAASREPARFFERWAEADRQAREEHDRRNPEDAKRRRKENDWSDL